MIALALWHLAARPTPATPRPPLGPPARPRPRPAAAGPAPLDPPTTEARPDEPTARPSPWSDPTTAGGPSPRPSRLIADDLRGRVTPEVLVKPNLVSHRRQLPSTHADTLSATLDAVFAAGAGRVVVAEGASDASAGFDRFGFRREAVGRPVRFLDLNRDETDWEPLELTGRRRLAAVGPGLADGRLGRPAGSRSP